MAAILPRPQCFNFVDQMTSFKMTMKCRQMSRPSKVISLPPGRCGNNFINAVFFFKSILPIDVFNTSHEIDLRWVPQNSTDDKSALVEVMAWWHQATSHYLSQYCPRSMMPYGVTRPQRVNLDCYLSHYSFIIQEIMLKFLIHIHWQWVFIPYAILVTDWHQPN